MEEERIAELEEEEEKKVVLTYDDAIRDWGEMLERLPGGSSLENTKNRRGERARLRSMQQRWLDKWVRRLAPPGKYVLLLMSDDTTRWLGPKQPIIFGNFVPMKALVVALGRQPRVALYAVREHGTSHTCSVCGTFCEKLKRANKKDIWRIVRCTNPDCHITWHRDWYACADIGWKGLSDLYPGEYPPERLFDGLTPHPDDLRRFRDVFTDVEDKYAKKKVKGHYTN